MTACHVTLYYYLGFSYLMLRRYVDAVKTFASILAFRSRAKPFHSRSYQADQTAKKVEQLYALLAIAISLCPQRVDEHVHATLREKYADKIPRLQQGDPETIEELFSYACPRFVLACPPSYDELPPVPQTEDAAAAAAAAATPNPGQEPIKHQLRLFQREVQQQRMLPTIRSYLRLYTSIPLPKLAGFLGQDIEVVRRTLMCYRHKSRSVAWQSGALGEGRWVATGDVDFYIDGDMVHMRDGKVPRRVSDYFLRSINRLSTLNP